MFITYTHLNNAVLCQVNNAPNPPKQNFSENKTIDSKNWHVTVFPKQEPLVHFYGDF